MIKYDPPPLIVASLYHDFHSFESSLPGNAFTKVSAFLA